MGRLSRRAALGAVLSLVLAAPALAAGPKLLTTLTGPAIGRVTPKGKAEVDQSKFPREAPELQVEVENVNLPNGSVLIVMLAGQPVGTLNVALGSARLNTTLAGVIDTSAPIVVLFNGMPILANPGPWRL